MDLKDGRYVALIIFVYGRSNRDWLVNVWRDAEGPWQIEYRFRYYAGTGDDDDDEKNFYGASAPRETTEREVCGKIRAMADFLVASGFNDKIDIIEPKTDQAEKVIELMTARPWCHARPAPGMAQA